MTIKSRAHKRGRYTGRGAEGRTKHAHDRSPSPPPRFRSSGHKNFHDSTTRKRNFIPEKPLAASNSIFDSLEVTPVARGWGRFVSHPSPACKNIVREFYANAKSLPGSPNLPRFESYVRGCEVKYDSCTINSLFRIPPPADDEICYYDLMLKGDFSPAMVIKELCVAGAVWNVRPNGQVKTLNKKDLKLYPLEFLNFVLATILPSSHSSDVTLERVFILYNIMTGRYMDLGRIIADGLARAIDSNRAIICPSLVFKLCVHAGVPNVIEDEFLPGAILGNKMAQKRSTDFDYMPHERMEEETEEEYRVRCTAANERPISHNDRVMATLERNGRKMDKIIKFLKFLYKEVRSIKKRFRKRNRSPSPDIPSASSSGTSGGGKETEEEEQEEEESEEEEQQEEEESGEEQQHEETAGTDDTADSESCEEGSEYVQDESEEE